jgi:hypothetical protein
MGLFAGVFNVNLNLLRNVINSSTKLLILCNKVASSSPVR